MVRPASRWAPRPHSGVAGFPWNQWQLCYGISGNFRVEQVAALAWNRWQDSPGISGSFGVEYAALENLKDRAVVIFKIYMKFGNNVFIEIDDFANNPLILKPFEVFK